MVELLRFFIEQSHQVHRAVLDLNDIYGWALSDKELHFILFGLAAVLLLIGVQFIFKRLAKISVSTISFIYTFTVMFALAMAIEFGQRITQQGIMDYEDVVAGMWGVALFMLVYLFGRWVWNGVHRIFKR